MTKMQKLTINSFNTRGLRSNIKRPNIFNWLKKDHSGITMLQETHSILSDQIKWQQEWGGGSISHMGNTMHEVLQP